MNDRRELIVALGASALAALFGSFAQQKGKVWRVGALATPYCFGYFASSAKDVPAGRAFIYTVPFALTSSP